MKLLVAISASLLVAARTVSECCSELATLQTCSRPERACVAAFDPFCETSWDSQCIKESTIACGLVCADDSTFDGDVLRIAMTTTNVDGGTSEKIRWTAVCAALNCKVQIVPVSDFSTFASILKGEQWPSSFDIISSGITVTSERASFKTVLFSKPYFASDEVLVAATDLGITSAEDFLATNKKIGVIEGTSLLATALQVFGAERLSMYTDATTMFRDIYNGDIGGFIDDVQSPPGVFTTVATYATAAFAFVLNPESPLAKYWHHFNHAIDFISEQPVDSSYQIPSSVEDFSFRAFLSRSRSVDGPSANAIQLRTFCAFLGCTLDYAQVSSFSQFDISLNYGVEDQPLHDRTGKKTVVILGHVAEVLAIPAWSSIQTIDDFNTAQRRIIVYQGVWSSVPQDVQDFAELYGHEIIFERPSGILGNFGDAINDILTGKYDAMLLLPNTAANPLLKSLQSPDFSEVALIMSSAVEIPQGDILSMKYDNNVPTGTPFPVGSFPSPSGYDLLGGTIKIGVQSRKTIRPFYTVDLWQFIVSRLGGLVEFVVTEFDHIGPILDGEKQMPSGIDFISSGISLSGARANNVAFSHPYQTSEEVLVFRGPSDVVSAADFIAEATYILAVVEGSFLEQSALVVLEPSRVQSFGDLSDVKAAVLSGAVRAALVDDVDVGLLAKGDRFQDDLSSFAFFTEYGSKWERRMHVFNDLIRAFMETQIKR